MRSVVLFEVVEDHQRATGPVKMLVQITDKVSEFRGGRARPEDSFKLVRVIKAIRGSSRSYQGELPVGREPSDGRDRVRAAGSDERVWFVVKFYVHSDNLRLDFGARTRGILCAVVQEVDGVSPQKSALLDLLLRHSDRGEDARRCPRILQIVRQHHRYGNIPVFCSASRCEYVYKQRNEKTASHLKLTNKS